MLDSDLFTSCSVARLSTAERFGRRTLVLPMLSQYEEYAIWKQKLML